ncbi:Rad21/Rec8-like protein N-terminal [Arabidopsis thaliana x Arabidopsis arenosa]|uniref:Rad21/Rec8-like protein N-terminal n=1 Tax=Arabidopsis thaliana x Arabidopsis arenosa TaxID=1240361 RepID=A0A8T1YDN3_9BRAS|nr:Rad21/Rec8-like protein N-terminal [Arabidopsis thaliana x Arabidopsis arenosa]
MWFFWVFFFGCTDQILQKELDALTYRVLAYLLLGVVRIYSKKVDFLFDDCNKALIGVKEFVAKEKNREKTGVSLPASIECFSIALPERFELDAFDLGILEDFHGGNVKPQEDITLKDGSQETESMDMYSMERFDMEEDLLFTFHETFSANHNENKHESFAHDMDMDAENVRDTTEEPSVRVVEAVPLDSNESSRDHQNASRHREDPESDDILVEPQISDDIRKAQEEDTVRETICTIVQRLVDSHESSGDHLHRDGHTENLESEKTSKETSCEEMPHDRSLPSECGRPEAIHGIEDQPYGATRINGAKEIPEMSTLEEPEPVSVTGSRDLPEGVEKCRDHDEVEMTDFELFSSECGRPEAIHGIEDQPYGATRSNGSKEIPEMSTLEEPEPVSVTGSRDLPEGVENCRDHNEVEMTDSELFHGSHKEQSETSEVNLHGTEKGFLSDMTASKDPSRGFNATDTPVAVTPKTPSRLKISEGGTSPQFSIIPTPAAKESSRVSRKRKCLIDDEVIIPNKVMKEMIEDSSKLLAKRRNVPHTDCPERRTKRFANPFRSFLDPLIQYGSLELQSLFCQPIKLKNWATTGTPKDAKIARRKKNSSLDTVRTPGVVLSSDQTENTQEIMETPQAAALAGLKVTAGNSNEVSVENEASSITSRTAHRTENAAETPVKPSVIAPETPVRTSEQTQIAPETPVVSEQVEIAPETPVRESMSIRFSKDPETYYKETRPASPFTSFEEHPSVYSVESRDLDTILMNDEVNADERQDLQQETWSARTRNVAKFLEKTFSEQRKREEEEKVSLLQLCRGRTQKESARLFYETLVLKTKGYLEVKQDHPYSDVLLTPFARQQKSC